MKNAILLLNIFLIGIVVTFAQAPPEKQESSSWLTDFNEAKELAKKTNKKILINFTGSDWCGWCIKLDKEVFSKEEFKKWSKDNLVLLKIDFPRYKKLPQEISQKNYILSQKYGVKGFPTILLTDENGKVVLRTGYKNGGVNSYITHLKAYTKK